MKNKPYIYIDNISKFHNDHFILENVSLSIESGEFFSILGHSGCGKTTLLRILAGFENNFQGRIILDGVDITHIPAYQRPINMMFQSYALFPHLNVWDNISFGLVQSKMSKDIIKQRTEEMLSLVNLEDIAYRMPDQLSGGQRQRVALARALAKYPKLLLLDEPLSALDEKLREKTQLELVDLQEQTGITFIFVTHNQDESMTISSRMAIMKNGRVLQIGTPAEIYEYPNCLTVAKFMGLINIFPGIVSQISEEGIVVSGEINYLTPHSNTAPLNHKVYVSIRPEKMHITHIDPKLNVNCIYGKVDDIAYLGDISIYYVETNIGRVIVTKPNTVRFEKRHITWNDNVYIYWDKDNAYFFA